MMMILTLCRYPVDEPPVSCDAPRLTVQCRCAAVSCIYSSQEIVLHQFFFSLFFTDGGRGLSEVRAEGGSGGEKPNSGLWIQIADKHLEVILNVLECKN